MNRQARIEHFVSSEPFDPHSIEALTPAQEKYYLASQWKLMWWKLKRHRLAVIFGIILALNYGSVLFSEIIAPYNLHTRNIDYIYSPPQPVHLFQKGEFIGPFVHGRDYRLDMDILKRIYTEREDDVQPLRFFCRGDGYKFWGLFEGNFHLVCPPENGTFFLLGTDRLGRDVLSRITYGARISLTIGLVGIVISFFFGILFGGLAGYYGGWVDSSVQRMIEVIRSFPELPLWMA
ncbi:MAG: ABC transporter permease, partial [Gammaproteobacteria bacterium]